MKYTKEEDEFIKENYEKYGSRFCADKLNRNVDAIIAKASRMGLKIKNKEIHPDYQKVSINNFQNINNRYVAYFLGFFWADGYIRTYKSKNITHWRITIEIKSDDADDIMGIFMSLGDWSIQKRKRNESWCETTSFVTNNKELYHFLCDNDYDKKSFIEPTKILRLIPIELQKYFWRGYFDGDGSAGLMGRGAYIEFSSTYDYEYSELNNLMNDLKITTNKIYRQISKKGHKSSVNKLYGKPNVILSKYFLSCEIGLKRKNFKLNQIIKKYETKSTSDD